MREIINFINIPDSFVVLYRPSIIDWQSILDILWELLIFIFVISLAEGIDCK